MSEMNETLLKARDLLTPKKNTQFFFGFLPERVNDVYDDVTGVDLEKKGTSADAHTYYEGKWSPSPKKIDKYRQGVELTRPVHYFSGLDLGQCKIHSGDPGSLWKKTSFGQGRTFSQESHFLEKENFNPVEFLRSNGVYTYPIVVGDNQNVESQNFDGVIEPLAIRAVASFFSIDVPFEAHSVWADLEDGNLHMNRTSDRVVTIYEINPDQKINPWLDMVDMVGNKPTVGYFNPDKTFITAFNDMKLRVELSDNLDEGMLYSVMSMDPATDSYITEGYRSAACGFMYDDVTVKGTDSLAFGGLGY